MDTRLPERADTVPVLFLTKKLQDRVARGDNAPLALALGRLSKRHSLLQLADDAPLDDASLLQTEELEKIGPYRICSARCGNRNAARVIFTVVSIHGKRCYLILGYTEDHDYREALASIREGGSERIRRFIEEKGVAGNPDSLKQFEEEWKAISRFFLTADQVTIDRERELVRLTGKQQQIKASFSNEESADKKTTAYLLKGTAGTGKTVVLFEIIFKRMLKLFEADRDIPRKNLFVYLTKEESLAREMQYKWNIFLEERKAFEMDEGLTKRDYDSFKASLACQSIREYVEDIAKGTGKKKRSRIQVTSGELYPEWESLYFEGKKRKEYSYLRSKLYQMFLSFDPEKDRFTKKSVFCDTSEAEFEFVKEAYVGYLSFLKSNNSTDINVQSIDVNGKAIIKKSCLVIDECQVLSLENLKLAASISQSLNFDVIMSYGLDQDTVHYDNHYNRLKEFLTIEKKVPVQEASLEYQLRCMPPVNDCICGLRAMIHAIKRQTKEESVVCTITAEDMPTHAALADGESGVYFHKESGALLGKEGEEAREEGNTLLGKIAQEANSCIVTDRENIEEARSRFNGVLVDTPERVMGFTYRNGIYYKPFADPIYKEINTVLGKIKETRDNRLLSEKEIERIGDYVIAIKKLITSVSRFSHNVYFVQDAEKHDYEHIMAYICPDAPREVVSAPAPAPAKSNDDEWLEQINQRARLSNPSHDDIENIKSAWTKGLNRELKDLNAYLEKIGSTIKIKIEEGKGKGKDKDKDKDKSVAGDKKEKAADTAPVAEELKGKREESKQKQGIEDEKKKNEAPQASVPKKNQSAARKTLLKRLPDVISSKFQDKSVKEIEEFIAFYEKLDGFCKMHSDKERKKGIKALYENTVMTNDHEVIVEYFLTDAIEGGNEKSFMCLIEGIRCVSRRGYNDILPLCAAVRAGFSKAVEMLIKKNVVVHDKDKEGRAPIYLAAEGGRLDIVEMLLPKLLAIGVNLDVSEFDIPKDKPIYIAAKNGHWDIVKKLIPLCKDYAIIKEVQSCIRFQRSEPKGPADYQKDELAEEAIEKKIKKYFGSEGERCLLLKAIAISEKELGKIRNKPIKELRDLSSFCVKLFACHVIHESDKIKRIETIKGAMKSLDEEMPAIEDRDVIVRAHFLNCVSDAADENKEEEEELAIAVLGLLKNKDIHLDDSGWKYLACAALQGFSKVVAFLVNEKHVDINGKYSLIGRAAAEEKWGVVDMLIPYYEDFHAAVNALVDGFPLEALLLLPSGQKYREAMEAIRRHFPEGEITAQSDPVPHEACVEEESRSSNSLLESLPESLRLDLQGKIIEEPSKLVGFFEKINSYHKSKDYLKINKLCKETSITENHKIIISFFLQKEAWKKKDNKGQIDQKLLVSLLDAMDITQINAAFGPLAWSLLHVAVEEKFYVLFYSLMSRKGIDTNDARCNIEQTPLMVAAHMGEKKVVEKLLEQGVDVGIKRNIHGRAIDVARRGGHNDIVKMLISHQKDYTEVEGVFPDPSEEKAKEITEEINCYFGTTTERSNLLAVIPESSSLREFFGRRNIVRLRKLSEFYREASENFENYCMNYQFEEIEKLGKGTPATDDRDEIIEHFFYAVNSAMSRKIDKEKDEQLLIHVVNLTNSLDSRVRECDYFYFAASEGFLSLLKVLVREKHVNVNKEIDGHGFAITLAAKGGHAKFVKQLLEYGANVDVSPSPITAAAVGGHWEIVNMLIRSSSSSFLEAEGALQAKAFSTEDFARISVTDEYKEALAEIKRCMEGVVSEQGKIFDDHLKNLPESLRSKSKYQAKTIAELSETVDFFKKLDDCCKSKDKDYIKINTLSKTAHEKEHLGRVVDFFLQAEMKKRDGRDEKLLLGLSSGIDINKGFGDRDDSDAQITLLHIAVKEKYTLLFNVLMRRENIDVNVRDKMGVTPLYIAVTYKRVEMVEALLKHKPVANCKLLPRDCTAPLIITAILDGNKQIALMLVPYYNDYAKIESDLERALKGIGPSMTEQHRETMKEIRRYFANQSKAVASKPAEAIVSANPVTLYGGCAESDGCGAPLKVCEAAPRP
ncbi:MAG TPA: ankyrin repeat domain-containing protein [Gammaproteobacteria bacterium]|jgi:ankyrin repeat protein|nr:ankyrin repeat domain-containing protein [Gammaproteobacteria bacterium]